MQNHDAHIIPNSSSCNYYEGQKKDNHKLLLYKNINEKKNNNLYYFYNEDTEQNPTKPQKYKQMFNKIKNNSLINGLKNNNKNNISNNKINNNNNNTNDVNKNNSLNKNNILNNNNVKNNELAKRKSVINYVAKVDKSKNLFVFKGNDNKFGFDMAKEERENRNNKGRLYIRYDKNRNDSSKNINANEIKIFSQKKMELPISSICYFNKCSIYKEKKIKLPISTVCCFNKITVYTEEKIKMPISEICYFNKSFVVKEIKIRENIINDFYFCTKTKKINEKKEKSLIIENCIEFDFIKTITRKLNLTSKKPSNLKTKKLNNSQSKSKSKSRNKNDKIVNTPKIFKYQPKPKKKNKENETKFLEYKKKLNNRLKNYKTIKHDDIMKKIQKEEKDREEKKNKLKKNVNKSVSINNVSHRYNFIPKQSVKRFIVSKTEHGNNNSRKEDNYKYINSSNSFYKTSANNKNYFKYSFYSLFDINSRYNNDNSGNEEKSQKSNKKILKRFIENGQNKNNKKEKEKEKYDKNNNNKLIMPKINDNINKQDEKQNTIINIQSSRFLIKKINSSNFKNRNINNSLFKMTKKQNNTNDNSTDWLKTQKKNDNNIYHYNNKDELPGLIEYKNINKNECNHIKYDKHFGNENNCPKCQSMDIKISYLKERKNEVIPKIDFHQTNKSFNQTIYDYNRQNIILPFKYFGKLYLKNYNNYKNTSKKFLTKLQRNNSVIQIKKINISKYSEQLLKNYKSSLLAIREYFNIK